MATQQGGTDELLHCFLLNARSLVNKLPDLHYLLYNCDANNLSPDVIFVTESWLNETISDGMLDPENKFTVIRQDRFGLRGGGFVPLLNAQLVQLE